MSSGSGSGEQWSPERVGEAVIEAFRILPTMPVYAPRQAGLVPLIPGDDPAPLDILAQADRVLGRSSIEHRILLVWGRSLATGGDVGGSVRQWCILAASASDGTEGAR